MFKKSDELMQNIDNVTTFLNKKIVLFDEKTGDAVAVIDLDIFTPTLDKEQKNKTCHKTQLRVSGMSCFDFFVI